MISFVVVGYFFLAFNHLTSAILTPQFFSIFIIAQSQAFKTPWPVDSKYSLLVR